ncbi:MULTISPECIES: BglG family transcription antiterminator LicT [Vagococcus]|uniref:Beta-glucoside bgl operon antiterminator, BglG family n=1 Tax=Vagococcus fluvialis bH819 TaxID=1255619 RepID=A0A1X6WJL2_9ENTE|nr:MULTISPECIES: PRD domain-containing protein [Vagococcus]SLM84481.1 Beta-glucoside bgl operon antiterminator, BglG family [Vagococcus fluvialis bH819]HCM90519.1 PRD domain-containing protein [Vagococcus sp.]
MVIHKVLNNNVVIVLDEKKEEQVVTGRGLAYKKKVGDKLTEENITQVFKLAKNQTFNKVQELLKEIPVDIIEVVDDIVKLARVSLNKEINDSVYLSLMDHINGAIEREKQGIELKNILIWDIKRFFPEEYLVGKEGLKLVNEKLNRTLSKEEAGFITLHLVNAEMSDKFDNIYELTELMSQITNIVKYHFKVDINEQSVYFDRFSTHLKYFCYRILNQRTYNSKGDDDLFEMVKIKYGNEYECVTKISEYVKQRYKYKMPKEEQLYLMIHITKLINYEK